MKQHQRTGPAAVPKRSLFPIQPPRQSRRRAMNRLARTSLLFIFTLLVAAFLVAALLALAAVCLQLADAGDPYGVNQ